MPDSVSPAGADAVGNGHPASAGLVDPSKVDQARAAFIGLELNDSERAVAAVHIAVDTLKAFRKNVAQFRQQVGDEAAADFARHVLNDLIYELQDAIPPTIRAYNALLRDLEQNLEAPAE